MQVLTTGILLFLSPYVSLRLISISLQLHIAFWTNQRSSPFNLYSSVHSSLTTLICLTQLGCLAAKVFEASANNMEVFLFIILCHLMIGFAVLIWSKGDLFFLPAVCINDKFSSFSLF